MPTLVVDFLSSMVNKRLMEHWNQKVAQNRGKDWKKKLLTGRLEAQKNPTKLKLARVKRGLSQGIVAQEIGVTYATYGAIENAHRPVTEERAKRIAQQLGVSFSNAFAEKLVKGEPKYIAKRG